MSLTALRSLGSRLWLSKSSSSKPSLTSRLKLYWTNVALDYKSALVEIKDGAVKRPIRAVVLSFVSGVYVVCFNTRPDLSSFEDRVREARVDVVQVPKSIRNESSMKHLQSLVECCNDRRLRTQSILGVATLLWEDNGDDECALYTLQCPHLKVGYLERVQRMVDVGLVGRWWRLDNVLNNVDVNDNEWDENTGRPLRPKDQWK